MKKTYTLALFALLFLSAAAVAKEARLVRYPHYHEGHVAFSYLGDIWTADEDGRNVQRLTVNRARDVYPRFSPDGKWIAFSSDRNGNLDVYVIPSAGGTRQTAHLPLGRRLGARTGRPTAARSSSRPTAARTSWPSSTRSSVDGGMPASAGADMGVQASYSPDGQQLAYNRKAQSYWRKYYRGSYQSDVTVDGHRREEVHGRDRLRRDRLLADVEPRRPHLFRQRPRRQRADQHLARPRSGRQGRARHPFTTGDVRWPAISARRQDDRLRARLRHLEARRGQPKASRRSRSTSPPRPQENLTEVRDFNSRGRRLRPRARRRAASSSPIHGEIFTAPVEEGDLRQITDSPCARPRRRRIRPTASGSPTSPTGAAARRFTSRPSTARASRRRSPTSTRSSSRYRWSPDSKADRLHRLRRQAPHSTTSTAKQTKEIASSRYGGIGAPAWSPDGKWIAYSKPDVSRTSDIYLIPSAGGEEKKVTFDSFSDVEPRFSPDGRKLYFVRNEGTRFGGGGDPLGADLRRRARTLERDPDDPEERAEPRPRRPNGRPRPARRSAARRRARGARGGSQPPKRDQDRLGRAEAAHPPGDAHAVRRLQLHPRARQPDLVFVDHRAGRPAQTSRSSTRSRMTASGSRRSLPARSAGDGDGDGRGGRGGFGGGHLGPQPLARRPHALLPGGRVVYSVALPPAGAARRGGGGRPQRAGAREAAGARAAASTSSRRSGSTSPPSGRRCSTTPGAR